MRIVFVISYITCYFTIITSRSNYEWWIENVNCTAMAEPSILSVINCELSKNLKRRTMSIEFKFIKKITQFRMNFKVILPRKPNDFVLLNLTNMDGCEFFSNKKQVTLLQLLRENLYRYSNIPSSCPIQEDIVYYVRGYRFNIELLPAFSFESDVIISFELIFQNTLEVLGLIKSHVGQKNTKKGKA